MPSEADEDPTATTATPRGLPVQPAPDDDLPLDLDPSEEDAQAELSEAITGDSAETLSAPLTPEQSADGATETKANRAIRQRLDRHLADHELIEQLRRGDFTGSRYDYFAEDLSRYGLSVMRGWLHTGYAFALLNERGLKITAEAWELEELALDPAARDELAVMTIATALPAFRQRALLDAGWDPRKGASITTYFMGACVLALANVFKERRRRQARWKHQDEKDTTTYDVGRRPEDVGALVAGREDLRARLAQYKSRERTIIAASLVGYSQEEIAEMYAETSARAVEGVLYRWRTQEKKLMKQEGLRLS